MVPKYASTLAAYHAAFAPELRGLVKALPIGWGDRILDAACGDGTYSRWLAERVGRTGQVWGADIAIDYLKRVPTDAAPPSCVRRMALAVADIERPPFAEGSFDLIWCAHSLYTLPHPVPAVRQMVTLLRPGGVFAVLENDPIHHVLLPWPADLELAVRAAELKRFPNDADGSRVDMGRTLLQLFSAHGLTECKRSTWTADRQAPFDEPAQAFLAHYLAGLRKWARPHLDAEMLARVELVLDPRSDQYLLASPGLWLTTVNHLVLGRRPWTD